MFVLIGKCTVAVCHDCTSRILCPLHMNPIVPEIGCLLLKKNLFCIYHSVLGI